MPTRALSGFRLSPQQERLWHLQQKGFALSAFSAVEIKGALAVNTLKAAVQDSINRHDSLRSHFQRLPGMKTPVMVVAESCDLRWEEKDWTGLSSQAQESQVAELLRAVQDCAEDLSQSSLFQGQLLQLASDHHLLILSMPALCLDAQSLRLLVQEISDRYEKAALELAASAEATSPEEIQYVQISEWQHQLQLEEDAQLGQDYWQAVPLSTLADLRLPFEGQSHPNFQMEVWAVQISAATIRDFAQQQNTAIQDILLACWIILLQRLAEDPDLVVGYGCDRRTYPEFQTVLGLLATWLPLHCPLTSDLHFSEVLTLLAEKCSAAAEWQDYFVWNADAAEPSFFPVGFEFAAGSTHWTAKHLSWTILQHHSCIERFKLKLTCLEQSETSEILDLALYYDANRFTAKAVQALAQQFQALLADAIADPCKPISTLNLLSTQERAALFVACEPPLESTCIHHLFETQVAQHPQAIALVYEDQQLTYAELNRQSNQLAHYLQQMGVGAEGLVGIYLGRSPQSIIALLAILKAGAAYLPLDPALPAAAIAARLQTAQLNWVITEQAFVDDLPLPDVRAICLDTEGGAIALADAGNPAATATPASLMYVLFTSGTTGEPKGVAVEHCQLYCYLCGILEQLNLPTRASFATVSTLAADLGHTAIFPALCTGGCLHLIAQERLSDPGALGSYIQQHQVDCLKIVPSHLQALLNTAHPSQLLPQRCLVLGGEALSWEFVAQLQSLKSNCRILNHYGPTETTVGVLTYAIPIHPGEAVPGETVPLGYPLAHTQVYVLDRQQQPVPKGLPGELYIGGATLARGYFQQPALTAERFIPHPFKPEGQQRLYKTGDRVCYREDGSLLFLGRLDRQVKVRGYRVELAEIEAVLQQQRQIRQAVVTAGAASGLVAYVVPHPSQPLHEPELKQILRQRLPEYMVPATFVFLKALPLTANGKVDLQALPAPAERQPAQSLTYTPPSTETEQAIAEIWQAALGLNAVGLHDNFFDLGGHSLLMVQVYSKLQEQFNPALTMGDLFRYPTISTLAEYLASIPMQGPSDEPSLQRSLTRAQTRKAMTQQRRRTQEVQDAAQ
jgi:amino acid adenylation domain-containing protein